MAITLKQIFDDHFGDVRYDNKFKENVTSFVRRFLAKNDDHVAFFGSGLIGVHPVRWNYSDTDTWWDDIFDVNDVNLQKDLFRHPDIKTNRVVSSDILNHAFIYSLHRIHHSTYLSEKDKEELKVRIMIAMNMKFICSLMSHYFRYPADVGVAEKTFNRLSMKFDIKVYGSWGKMIEARSRAFVAPNGRYYASYVDYTGDIEIIKMINDAQGRIRETFKEITDEFHKTLRAEAKVLSSSSSVNLDGTVMVKDLNRKRNTYIRYLKSVLVTKDSFVKEQLTQICYSAIPSLQPGLFEQLLEEFPKHYANNRYSKIFNRMLDNLLVFSFDVIENNDIAENDLSGIVYRLKHVYMSGRVSDKLLLDARYDFEKLVELTDKRLKGKPVVPERCGFFLYLLLRTLTMHYFK